MFVEESEGKKYCIHLYLYKDNMNNYYDGQEAPYVETWRTRAYLLDKGKKILHFLHFLHLIWGVRSVGSVG